MTGKLFVFEGPDGSGKTTMMRAVYSQLKKRGVQDIFCEKEPTGKTEASSKIYKILGNQSEYDITSEETSTRLRDLYHEDREFHIKYMLKPALCANENILLDRYWHSTAVYQSDGSHSIKGTMNYNRHVLKAPEPDMTFILKVPPEQVADRLLGRNPAQNNQFDNPLRYNTVNTSYEMLIATDMVGKYCVVYNLSELLTVRTITDVIETMIMEC